jgi:hypothetical protein
MNISDFKTHFSSSAFIRIDGDQAIVGKFGRIIQFESGVFDCWFYKTNKDGSIGALTGKKLGKIRRNLPAGSKFKELTGEGWCQGSGPEFVFSVSALLAVKKKRKAVVNSGAFKKRAAA